jgi:NAD(P)-dependent dehydrogenase (short-subunit alcohol dehydrogenase family)
LVLPARGGWICGILESTGRRRENQMAQTVLVTGASVGLGLAISRALMARGYRVVLTARPGSMHRFAELGIVLGPNVWLRPLDVTVAGHRESVIDEIESRLGGLDVLVNNAGVSVRSVVEQGNRIFTSRPVLAKTLAHRAVFWSNKLSAVSGQRAVGQLKLCQLGGIR